MGCSRDFYLSAVCVQLLIPEIFYSKVLYCQSGICFMCAKQFPGQPICGRKYLAGLRMEREPQRKLIFALQIFFANPFVIDSTCFLVQSRFILAELGEAMLALEPR